MARFSRIETIQMVLNQGLVPLFYNSDIELSKKVVLACYRGGGRLLEFTNRGDYAHEVFGQLSKFCESELPDMILGVGSVTDASTTSMYMQLGANFVVTPVLRTDIALTCNRRKIPYMPGCASLGEVCMAEELGCEIVKLFPGGTYGPSFVKSILGPQPWTSVMVTGGVNPSFENLQQWYEAGVICVGMGSKLISKDILESERFEYLEENIQKVLKEISRLKETN